MIEVLQGLLACIGATLFFAAMVIAIKSVIWKSPTPSLEDDDSGAPEGDQFHFRIVEDPCSSSGSRHARRGFADGKRALKRKNPIGNSTDKPGQASWGRLL